MATKTLTKMRLWYYPQYRSARCIWLVNELGIQDSVEYKYVPIGPPPIPPEREEYKKNVHPNSTVPALEIPGHPPMLESGAICMYLADYCGRLTPELKDRSEYYNWIVYASCTLDMVLEKLTRIWMYIPRDQWDLDAVAKAKAEVDVCLDYMENYMQGKDYILGKDFSAADCVVGYCIIWANLPEMDNGLLLKGRPNLQDYLARINARPGLKQAMELGQQ